MTTETKVTNSHYAQLPAFKNACMMYAETVHPPSVGSVFDNSAAKELAAKVATRRQASKFRRGTGVVYKTINNLPM